MESTIRRIWKKTSDVLAGCDGVVPAGGGCIGTHNEETKEEYEGQGYGQIKDNNVNNCVLNRWMGDGVCEEDDGVWEEEEGVEMEDISDIASTKSCFCSSLDDVYAKGECADDAGVHCNKRDNKFNAWFPLDCKIDVRVSEEGGREEEEGEEGDNDDNSISV